MNTSYFAKSAKHPKAVAICIDRPHFFHGRHYPKLAPTPKILRRYKRDGDVQKYTKQYKKFILDTLDAEEVWKELGEDAVLLCWEGIDKFCHRHLIAAWLSDTLRKEVTEL